MDLTIHTGFPSYSAPEGSPAFYREAFGLGRGIAEGHGGDSLTSLIRVLRTHRSE
ncbi:hypothetical protein [Nocardiopsis alba]|jgi:hypothetical protein|uniref:hypothetical protein n=1 Tax=Nocardiopsis alba TaxID=53437 RepID=UPI0033BF3CEF